MVHMEVAHFAHDHTTASIHSRLERGQEHASIALVRKMSVSTLESLNAKTLIAPCGLIALDGLAFQTPSVRELLKTIL